MEAIKTMQWIKYIHHWSHLDDRIHLSTNITIFKFKKKNVKMADEKHLTWIILIIIEKLISSGFTRHRTPDWSHSARMIKVENPTLIIHLCEPQSGGLTVAPAASESSKRAIDLLAQRGVAPATKLSNSNFYPSYS